MSPTWWWWVVLDCELVFTSCFWIIWWKLGGREKRRGCVSRLYQNCLFYFKAHSTGLTSWSFAWHAIWIRFNPIKKVKTDWKRSVFISVLKKGNAKKCSDYHTTAFISHASKVMLKIPQARLQQYMNHELSDVQAGFKRQRNQRSNCQHLLDHRKSKRVPKKHLFLLYWLCVSLWLDHNKLWKILKDMEIPDHLTCLLRNMYAGQNATVRTGHGTTDWFQIGKGVCQGCILSPAYLS